MKKLQQIMLIITSVFILTACNNQKEIINEENRNDKLPIAGMGWSREDGDTEILSFKEDGHFTYHCSCGNPVNDADLCETYTYNKETKEITLDCIETTDEMVRTIIVVSSTDTTLELDFAGEIRKFEKASE